MRTVVLGTSKAPGAAEPHLRQLQGHWGFNPRLCQPYRTDRSQGESGVKYVKRTRLHLLEHCRRRRQRLVRVAPMHVQEGGAPS